MPPPDRYDASSPAEQPVPLPSAPRQVLAPGCVFQPPLSRRGKGPGIVLFVPELDEGPSSSGREGARGSRGLHRLEPDVTTKWAEEGYSVLSIVLKDVGHDAGGAVEQGIRKMDEYRDDGDKHVVRDKVAVIIYDDGALERSSPVKLPLDPACIACVTLVSSEGEKGAVGDVDAPDSIPRQWHVAGNAAPSVESSQLLHTYPGTSGNFVLRASDRFDYAQSSLAHSRAVAFVKRHLRGPTFDLEAIWEEHTLYEFGERSVAKTMGTMVPEPYVNHLPTMTGGIGREELTAFYRDHFIFSNPPSVAMQLVSRCVGHDRLVEEFILGFTHDRMVDWMLPGVPPTGKKVSVPFTGAVSFRGDRLFYEHISWDQATVYRQIGLLPDSVPFKTMGGRSGMVRLPTTSEEKPDAPGKKLADPLEGQSNEMMGEGWGFQGST